MSLIRQVWLLLLATVLLAFAGSVGVVTTSTRDLLQTQLRLKNSDNAGTLALALSQQKGDVELMSLLMSAQFDTGYYRRVRLVSAEGQVVFNREAVSQAAQAPAWFVAAVPIASQPGVAQVTDGWRALGQVQVESHVSYAHDALWSSSVRSGDCRSELSACTSTPSVASCSAGPAAGSGWQQMPSGCPAWSLSIAS